MTIVGSIIIITGILNILILVKIMIRDRKIEKLIDETERELTHNHSTHTKAVYSEYESLRLFYIKIKELV